MRTVRLLSPLLIPLFFAGCGGGGDQQLEAVSKQAASQDCISCHISAVSPGTAQSITQEWEASVHNTANGAGCADCHDPAPGHPNVCDSCHAGGGTPTGDEVSRNPDAAGKCGKCHGPAHPGDVLMRLAPQHYGYSSATQLPTKARASFVSDQYVGQCRACHNPHAIDVTTNHREYAKSLHGDPKGVAFTYYDFKQNNYASCQRCHTSTGFKYFIANNFTSRTTGFSTGATTRELIACDACHSSYDYKRSVRQVSAFTAAYKNFNGTAAAYPDSGRSNLCIPCHSGRESAQAINAVADFGNAGFINSHYLAAAGLMYMQLGFINFTSLDAPIGSTTYGRSLSPDNVTTPGGIVGGTSSTHRKFGTPLIRGDFHNASFFVAGRADSNGPCVTCHLNVTGAETRAGHGHSLKIDGNAFRQLCVNCHDSEGTHTEVLQLNADNFRSKFLEPQAEAFEESLTLLEHEIAKYGVSFNESTYPYFYDDNLPLLPNGKKPPVKDWTRGGVLDGRKFMGACFNFNLLKREPAAYAHARSYSRRLIYDSIDYVDDRAMNLSVSATALSSGLTLADGSPAFVKDAQAYNTSGGAMSTIYGATSEPMLYLVGWSRSTGAWNAMERP